MTHPNSGVKRPRVVVAAVCLAFASIVGLNLQAADAHAPQEVAGQFTFKASIVTSCPVGSVVCSSGIFTGGLQGPFEFSITTLLPSATPGVSFFNGKLTLHTASGDIRCDLNGALNTNTSSQGEFGEICVITGGTGAYAGAKGHLRLFGTSTTSSLIPPTGGGDYKGTIVLV